MTEPFVLEQKQFLTLPSWKEKLSELIVGFTTKNGGISQGAYNSFNMGLHVEDSVEHVVENKQILANITDFPMDNWIGCEQTHGNYIVKVSPAHRGKGVTNYKNAIAGTDGIYTDSENVLLTLCFADCVPLYFFAPSYHYIGLAHAGWKGTVKEIGGMMIKKWEMEGVATDDIFVAIGPSISSQSYLVDDFVINQVKSILPFQCHQSAFKEVSKGQYELDLKYVNVEILKKAGIKEENILCSSFCTSTDHSLFFSHRRDQGKTGRMMSFIGLKGASVHG
ncbi:peptidoglycan editing factor PgeF [Sutcliffiella rhizosphaerae]|uniref:Purine nucleoside phosphorylase n=1 Tax=Sutcliffiella rhizosphaerae TaxID=2880967 RepID=A0ABN8A7P8_9BACI|nr:peptidoglycan editing factor PgeF [Sutcliffiella rhizosphaerae]CAG9619791.1 Polyphenol oxidase [Sutcliffiella rhizosphaerae]